MAQLICAVFFSITIQCYIYIFFIRAGPFRPPLTKPFTVAMVAHLTKLKLSQQYSACVKYVYFYDVCCDICDSKKSSNFHNCDLMKISKHDRHNITPPDRTLFFQYLTFFLVK